MGILTKILIILVALGVGAAMIAKFFFGKRGPARLSAEPMSAKPVADMKKCAVCGTYVAAAAPRCARADCPLDGARA
ncbi:MAG: hypothetical protein FJX61_07585 [Alphaproteobacteria bacterium]|nr:hypothetical protein [Alphaproteobacteria bacterium]